MFSFFLLLKYSTGWLIQVTILIGNTIFKNYNKYLFQKSLYKLSFQQSFNRESVK